MKLMSLIVALVIITGMRTADAQPVLTPRNMALGGGGVSYINDHNANFYNPANLLIREKDKRTEVSGPSFSLFVNAPLNEYGFRNAWNTFKDQYYPYDPGSGAIGSGDLPDFIADNYKNSDARAYYRTRYDADLFGLTIKSENRSISLALRRRTSSSYEVGKGWFSTTPVRKNDYQLVDRRLVHRYQTLYELSFGLAESFTFLNGLTSRLDNFSIGIAPKLVIGGQFQEALWDNEYRLQDGSSTYNRLQSISISSAGRMAEAFSQFRGGTSLPSILDDQYENEVFNYNGIGAGIDIGVTYLLSLGSDLSAIRSGDQTTRRSLRISFSITDIGLVRYTDNEQKLELTQQTTAGIQEPPASLSDVAFTGAPGQFLYFADQFGEDNPILNATESNGSFSTLLPISMNTGAMIELNRVKFMSDIRLGLTNNAFHRNTIYSSFGMEIRPLPFFALRSGVQLEGSDADFISLGTGIELQNWTLSVAALFLPEEITSNAIVTGYSAAALQFHF